MAGLWYVDKKTPPLAAKRNGGAGTEKRPTSLMIPSFAAMSIVLFLKSLSLVVLSVES
jgi:hypothetical protein